MADAPHHRHEHKEAPAWKEDIYRHDSSSSSTQEGSSSTAGASAASAQQAWKGAALLGAALVGLLLVVNTHRPPAGSPVGLAHVGLRRTQRAGPLAPPRNPPPFLVQLLPVKQPWQRQALPLDALARGLGPLGSGQRMARFASKLLAGQPATVVLLGGSVTYGAGASWWGYAYPALLADWLQKAFPRSNVTLLNRAIPASTSGLTAMCSERLVPEVRYKLTLGLKAADADLVVIEFTFNDPNGHPLGSPERQAPEMLLRKLLRIPAQPAVAVLHYYSWWKAGEWWWESGRFDYPSTEADLTLLAAYYDLPVLSLKHAVHPLLRQDVPGFKKNKLITYVPDFQGGVADPLQLDDYFYSDYMHPSDRGHQAMADLLIGLVQQAAAAAVAAAPRQGLAASSAGPAAARGNPAAAARAMAPAAATGTREAAAELPAPLQQGVVDAPTSLCLMQEDFKGTVVKSRGFEYRPERPNATKFVGQKWGWSSSTVGAYAELLVDTREDGNHESSPPRGKFSGDNSDKAPALAASDSSGSASGVEEEIDQQDERAEHQQHQEQQQRNVTVYLGHLRSWKDFGQAKVECLGGCSCERTVIDGAWSRNATLQQTHAFTATQHAACRLRVTVLKQSSSEAHRVVLNSIMVSSVPYKNYAEEFEEMQGALEAGR